MRFDPGSARFPRGTTEFPRPDFYPLLEAEEEEEDIPKSKIVKRGY